MTYKEGFKKAYKEYSDMLAVYEKETSSTEYFTARSRMPFGILPAVNLCEQFMTFDRVKGERQIPHMEFGSVEKAISFFKDMLAVKKNISGLLDTASYLNDVCETAEAINSYVVNSPYLTEEYCVPVDEYMYYIAKEALKELPKYSKLLTKDLYRDYLESCVACLDEAGLKILADKNIIKGKDIDRISLSHKEIPGYDDHIRYLCTLLGHNNPLLEEMEIKLNGVTFNNEDGSSRQENLKELAEYVKDGNKPELVADPYVYHNPKTGNDEPACFVKWSGKVLGNVGAGLVKELTEKYKNPVFAVSLKEIVGGGDISYGLRLNLGVCASQLQIEQPEVEVG